MQRRKHAANGWHAGEIEEKDPFRCRMWSLHDRLDDYITEESCRSEIESVRCEGQLIPALGRRLQGDPGADVELIYGARRLFVARYLKIPIRVRIENLDDRQALIAMDIENRRRKDISPYERGRSFKAWLKAGVFQYQEEIAAALHISASQVSRLLRVGSLPAILVAAFESPLHITEAWGVRLATMWDDPACRRALADRAREISRVPRRSEPQKIFALLTGAANRPMSRSQHNDTDVVLTPKGRPLFKLTQRNSTVCLTISKKLLNQDKLTEIKRALTVLLDQSYSELVSAALPAPSRAESSEAAPERDGLVNTLTA